MLLLPNMNTKSVVFATFSLDEFVFVRAYLELILGPLECMLMVNLILFFLLFDVAAMFFGCRLLIFWNIAEGFRKFMVVTCLLVAKKLYNFHIWMCTLHVLLVIPCINIFIYLTVIWAHLRCGTLKITKVVKLLPLLFWLLGNWYLNYWKSDIYTLVSKIEVRPIHFSCVRDK